MIKQTEKAYVSVGFINYISILYYILQVNVGVKKVGSSFIPDPSDSTGQPTPGSASSILVMSHFPSLPFYFTQGACPLINL